MTVMKSDIQTAAGCLQTCTGVRSGVEAAIHASHAAWNSESTEAVLQVDADNAFNRLNRQVALHNIKQVCPSVQQFLHNHIIKKQQNLLLRTLIHRKLSTRKKVAPKGILLPWISTLWV